MTPALLVPLAVAAGALVIVWWSYLRRELPVAGRTGLAVLRSISILAIVVLILDPELPDERAARARTILDASPSVSARLADGSLPDVAPLADADPVEPADAAEAVSSAFTARVARAIESGATSVTLVTDGRLRDAVELRALVDRAPVTFDVRDVGGPVVNAGVESITAPAGVRAGDAFDLLVTVVREGAGAPGVVEILLDGEPVASETLPAPASGGLLRTEVRPRVTLPERAGAVRLTARVRVDGDAFADDDARSVLVEVDRERGAIAVVSVVPGWEARFLISTLAEVGGLPVVGFMRVVTADGERFLRTGETPGLVTPEEVARAVEDAALVVRQGDGAVDSLVARALASAPRRVDLGVGIGDVRRTAAEWYVSGELPSSPLAAELAGLRLLGLPPLRRVPESDAPTAAGSPLLLRADGTGDPVPAMLLRETSAGRTVEVPATGWWRWALRPGEPATLYRRLWSGITGWVLAGGRAPESAGIAPRDGVVAPEAPVVWNAAPAADARLEVRWWAWDADDEAAPARVDTVAVDGLGRAVVPGLSEGDWRWATTVLGGEADGRERDGRLVAERWTDDLLVPRDARLDELRSTATPVFAAGRPLRASPWPWLLVVLMLSAEWIVRRRTGLR